MAGCALALKLELRYACDSISFESCQRLKRLQIKVLQLDGSPLY
jgi:hypothetical protein